MLTPWGVYSSTLGLDRVEWLTSRPGPLTFSEGVTNTHRTGGWVEPRVGLDVLDKKKLLSLNVIEPRTEKSVAWAYCKYPCNIFRFVAVKDPHYLSSHDLLLTNILKILFFYPDSELARRRG